MNYFENRRLKFNKSKKEEMDKKRLEDIVDQRYRENLSQLHNELNVVEMDKEVMHDNALKEKKELDSEKDTIFLKKWE